MNHFNNILRSKEYSSDLITSAINKAKDIPQGELRKVKAKTQDKNTLAFVSTYNPHNPNIFPMIKNTLPILRQSNKLSKVVDNIKIINSKRQSPNLKKIRTRARFHSDESTPTIIVTKCTDSRCGTREHLQEGNNIILKPSNYKFNVKHQCTVDPRVLSIVLHAVDVKNNILEKLATCGHELLFIKSI